MNAGNLNAIGAGFNNEALGSQAVFRTALDALSRPGRWSPIARDAQTPATSNPAAAALLLALLEVRASFMLGIVRKDPSQWANAWGWINRLLRLQSHLLSTRFGQGAA